MKSTYLFKSCFALAVALTGLGCESDNRSESRGDSAMGATIGALESAVNGCRDQRESCEANLSDATVDKSCKEAFDTCKKSAIEAAMPDLAKDAKECGEQGRACREAAADDPARLACRDELKACVAEDRADHGGGQGRSDSDAGEAEHESPVAGCTTALRTCLEGDSEAKLCTDQLRACLEATLPNHARGHDDRSDAGKPERAERDAGAKPEPGDRGQSEEHKPGDAGTAEKPEKPEKPERPERDGGRGQGAQI